MTCRLATPQEIEQGYTICDCGKYAHVFKASVLANLSKDYHGECCKECSCFMVAVDKLNPSAEKG